MMFHFYIPEGICFAAFVAINPITLHADGNIPTKGNKSSEADSFRNIKMKHHTHLKMAM
jgi:hypothetical protein